jgi:hypothetical protein
MTAPIAARDVAAAAGALLVLSTVVSVVGTVIVPRKSGSRLTRLVASGVTGIFGLIVRPVPRYRWRDRILSGQAAVILLGQLAVWLGSFYVGYVNRRPPGPISWDGGSIMSRLRTRSPQRLTPFRLSGPGRADTQRSRCPRYAQGPACPFPSTLRQHRGQPDSVPGHQSNRELPPITDSILVVRPDIQ